ncbi:exported porin [Caballeronia arationis]|jgi:predicted porin|uniref:hypothetical protein n=1 Tax=Caballeronia arationis TaxID=1777142 RepID=UPI00074C3F75|nr:hypothetical protein [Caballeronia arationis]SAK94146.1 exported porin [Caballeronia arationis]
MAKHLLSDGTSLSLNSHDASISYTTTPRVDFCCRVYQYKPPVRRPDANPHWNGAQCSLDYSLSKRTEVYVFDTFQRKSGSHAVADVYLYAPSTSSNQNVLVAGIRHRF